MRNFWQSYKRLPRRHKITLGIVGVLVGLSGPTLMDKLTSFLNKVCVKPSIVEFYFRQWLRIHTLCVYVIRRHLLRLTVTRNRKWLQAHFLMKM